MSDRSVDEFEIVARRSDLLSALRGGSRQKRALVEALSTSRSTVDRAVRSLESRGLVERHDAVSLTLRGRMVLDVFEHFTDTVTAIDDARVLLEPLPADAIVDPVLLRDATVVGPDPVSPQRPFFAYQELLEDAVEVHGFAPAILNDNIEFLRDRIVEDGLRADITVSPDALDELVSAHADPVDEALDTGNLALHRAQSVLEYSLMLVEHRDRTIVCALFYDDPGLVGSLHNADPDAVRWAERVNERLRSDAEPLTE